MLVSLDRVVVILMSSVLGCLVAGPGMIRGLISLRWRQPVRHEDCPPLMPLHQSKQGTPTMGGVLVLGVAIVVAAGFGGFAHPHGWAIASGIMGLGVVGLIDDWLKLRSPYAKGLRCLPKLVSALAVGGLIGFAIADPRSASQSVGVPWVGARVELGWLWVPVAAVVVAGSAHAVNLTDGMDGLAAGCLALAFGALGVVGFLTQDPLVTVWGVSLAGACLGFLWFNTFPASVFLGDVGSLGLGGALGVLAILADAMLALVIVGGIFVAEAVSVMLQVASYRWRNKRRIFRVAPLHHHFQLGGIPEHKLVVRFWIVGFLLAVLGLTAVAHS